MKLEIDSPYFAAHFPLMLPSGDMLVFIVVKVTREVANGALQEVSDPFPVWEHPQQIDGRMHMPDLTPTKEGTDLVVLADAKSPAGRSVRTSEVVLRVGQFSRRLLVFGDRSWTKTSSGFVPGEPEPFIEQSLDWQHAYGGVALDGDGQPHGLPENPVGKGLVLEERYVEQTSLPNVEAPERQIRSWTDRPAPSGVGFYPQAWGLRLRSGLEAREGRPPLILPAFFNQAHPDFVLSRFPQGEELWIEGVSPSPLKIRIDAPSLRVELEGPCGRRHLPFRWDTICVLPDRCRLYFVGRAGFLSPSPSDGASLVRVVRATSGGLA